VAPGTHGALAALVVDDEKNIRATLTLCLESLGCRVTALAAAEPALVAAAAHPFDLAFIDLRLGPNSGLDLVPRLLAERPDLSIVVITAYATVDTAVEAMRRGARLPAQALHAGPDPPPGRQGTRAARAGRARVRPAGTPGVWRTALATRFASAIWTRSGSARSAGVPGHTSAAPRQC
jgi:CheY-like chemotaxis protein